MNHEYKYTLIENESEYKNSVLKEIENITDENLLLKYIDKIISIQYYKGLFYDASEFSELAKKINELYDIEIENSIYENNEFKYFIKELLENYDIFIDELEFNIEISESIKIKTKYLISELDSSYYLDEISSDYNNRDKTYFIDEISVYENKDEFIASYINEFLSCYLIDNNLNDSLITKYFNYDEYISDLESEDEILIIFKYNNTDAYIIDYNKIQ